MFCIMSLSFAVQAQKRTTKKPVPKATPKTSATAVLKDESQKVAAQIKSLTRFIYILGGTAQTIEDIDRDPRATAVVRQQSNAGKQTVLQTIRSMRAAVVQLENDFHARPELRNYIPFIQGVSETMGLAEDQAVGGELKNSGKTLLEVVNRLTDTLLNLR